MRTLIAVLILSFWMHRLPAQNQFLIYSLKGNVSAIENNKEEKVKVGKLLSATSTLKLDAGATVSLICNEVNLFTLSKPGNYQLSKFGDSCNVNRSSLSASYLKFVWAQLTKPSASVGSNRNAYMQTTGAVTRSLNDIWIDPRLDTINYCEGDFPLSWKCYSDAKEFDFMLFNSSNILEPFYTTSVKKLKISIPSFINRLKPGNTYYWIAAVKGGENEDRKVFNYVKKETYEQLLKKIKSQIKGYESPAEEAFRTAFMLEDAHYLAEAYQYYQKAASLDSANVLYRSTLMAFKKDYEIK
ncbi:MAG: hypothetical protein N2747_10995 [Chitinophagaceae bacterium]|nr:hypothetical protein [Chitinophagaceae bacterium]